MSERLDTAAGLQLMPARRFFLLSARAMDASITVFTLEVRRLPPLRLMLGSRRRRLEVEPRLLALLVGLIARAIASNAAG